MTGSKPAVGRLSTSMLRLPWHRLLGVLKRAVVDNRKRKSMTRNKDLRRLGDFVAKGD